MPNASKMFDGQKLTLLLSNGQRVHGMIPISNVHHGMVSYVTPDNKVMVLDRKDVTAVIIEGPAKEEEPYLPAHALPTPLIFPMPELTSDLNPIDWTDLEEDQPRVGSRCRVLVGRTMDCQLLGDCFRPDFAILHRINSKVNFPMWVRCVWKYDTYDHYFCGVRFWRL